MPTVRESTTAVVVRGEWMKEGFVSEPYEAGWASEATVFVLGMDSGKGGSVRVQISPDGMAWADEGTEVGIPGEREVAFARVSHFGNWLRIRASVADDGQRRVMATFHFKG